MIKRFKQLKGLLLLSFLIISIFILSLTGCASVLGNIKTTITDPVGKVWVIESKSDSVVSIKKKDGTEVVIDNRGRPSILETAFGLAMVNMNVNLGLSNKPQEIE